MGVAHAVALSRDATAPVRRDGCSLDELRRKCRRVLRSCALAACCLAFVISMCRATAHLIPCVLRGCLVPNLCLCFAHRDRCGGQALVRLRARRAVPRRKGDPISMDGTSARSQALGSTSGRPAASFRTGPSRVVADACAGSAKACSRTTERLMRRGRHSAIIIESVGAIDSAFVASS